MTTTINASTSAGLVQTADTSGILQLQTANTAALTIDGSQNVGVGTASPSSYGQFVVYSATTGVVRAYGGAVGAYMFASSSGGLGAVGTETNNAFALYTNGTERARIDTSGNVGIGASPPNTVTKFYVEQSGGNVLGYFNSTATSQNARIRINSTDNASSVAYVWSYSHASLNKQASIYLTGTGALAIQVGQTAGSEPTSGTSAMFIDSSGSVLVANPAGLGYGTGSGGTVTQATSKATAVTLNKPTGQITMNNAALAASTTVAFQLTNSVLATTDVTVVTMLNGGVGTPSNYQIWTAAQSGSCIIYVRNISAGSLSEAIVLNFAVIKGATS